MQAFIDSLNTFLHFTSLLKIGILALLVLFVIFQIVVIRQITALDDIVVQIRSNTFLQVTAILLLLSSIALFIAAFVIL